MRLISLADLKAFIEITVTNFDTLLGTIIEYYSQRFEAELNRKLKKQARTENFNGGRKLYYLPAYPIDLTQTLTVKIDGSTYTKDSDFYVWDTDGLIEFIFDTPTTKPRIVEVTWTGGYTESTGGEPIIAVPDDLKGAMKLQCSFLFRRRNDLGLTSISMPDGSVSVQAPAKLLPEVEQLIKAYRKTPTDL